MKLLKANLVNFRRFIEEEINLNLGLNVFVGRNNSGKSTVLEAIGLALNYPGMGGIELNKAFDTGTCVVRLLLTLDQEEWSKIIKLVRHEFVGRDEPKLALSQENLEKLVGVKIVDEWKASFSEGRRTSASRTFSFSNPEDSTQFDAGVRNVVQRALSFLAGQNLVQLFASTTYLSTERRLQGREAWIPFNQLIGRENAQEFVRNRLLNLKRKSPEKFQELKTKILSVFDMEDIDVDLNWDTGELNFVIKDRRKEYDINEMGGGTRSFIFLFSYLYFSGMDIALIDEPDINMHPLLVKDLVDFFRILSKDTQLILTSHNKAFIDCLNEEEIYRVEHFDDIGSKVRRLDSQSDRWSLLEHLGISLSGSEKAEGTFAKLVVFTEGPSDVEYIEKFANKIGKHEQFLEYKPLCIPIEGSAKRRNKVDPIIFDKIWKDRLGVPAPIFLILDKDESTQQEITKDVELFGESRIHYLNRREIENYMLNPKAILELLREKSKRYGRNEDVVIGLKNMTEDDILRKLSELIEEGRLQHKVRMLRFLKRLHPLRFISYEDVSGLIEESYSKADEHIVEHLLLKFYEKVSEQSKEEMLQTLQKVTENLAKEWDNNKLLLCSGKDLFTLINKWTEKEYGITLSPKDVIDYLDHVDDEIVQLINKILSSSERIEGKLKQA